MLLVSLQLKTSNKFKKNLKNLIREIKKTPPNSIILAPELALSSYSYTRLEEAAKITNNSIKMLKKLSKNKIIALTMTTKTKGEFYNTLYIFYKNKIVHTQSKSILFILNHEHKYFSEGDINDIKIINIEGTKIAALICFELRFIDLWKKVQGADIILIPAMWGILRKEHYESLTKSLAITNQCYVIASNSSNKNMARSSAIISPFGDVTMNNTKKSISSIYNPKEITKMRRYINIGIK